MTKASREEAPEHRPALFDVLSRLGVLANRGHVLVVDDEADMRVLLEQELVAAGYRVRSAEGGAQALAEMEKDPPSAVLLDLMMPSPDGFEVLYHMRQSQDLADIPVIVVTARELTAADQDRLNGTIQRVVRKGSDVGRLVREVLGAIPPPQAARTA